MDLVKTIPVSIIKDPFTLLERLIKTNVEVAQPVSTYPYIYLRLYTVSKAKGKYVPEKSGLNQWHADGRPRHPDEVYIPISSKDHKKTPGFFPPRDQPFNLFLPNGKEMSAKICQDNDKALMSNPNKALGEWILRSVLKLKQKELLTYEMFERIGIDSVLIEKINERQYRINFAKIGSYEEFMGATQDELLDDD